MFVKKQDEVTRDLNAEWVVYILDSNVVENGPRDLLGVEETQNALTISFKSENGMYYAMGRLDRYGVSSWLGKTGSMTETNRKVFQRRFLKNYRDGETNHKIFVRALNPSDSVNKSKLWHQMNCLGDLCSVCVKENGRYAFLSYATAASVYYTVGYFENDTVYDVQLKNPVTELILRFGCKEEEDWE